MTLYVKQTLAMLGHRNLISNKGPNFLPRLLNKYMYIVCKLKRASGLSKVGKNAICE